MYPGATKPLIRPPRHDPQIHGADGLGGVEGLPPEDHPDVKHALDHPDGVSKATEGIARAIRDIWKDGSGSQVTLISCGPTTNIALFFSVYPELLPGLGECLSSNVVGSPTNCFIVDEYIFMGGGVGLGNRTASAGSFCSSRAIVSYLIHFAEFNILCDRGYPSEISACCDVQDICPQLKQLRLPWMHL